MKPTSDEKLQEAYHSEPEREEAHKNKHVHAHAEATRPSARDADNTHTALPLKHGCSDVHRMGTSHHKGKGTALLITLDARIPHIAFSQLPVSTFWLLLC